MKVLFDKTVNDKYNPGNTFFKGRTYDLSNERVAELASTVPEAILVLDEATEEISATQSEPKKKASKKTKKHVALEDDNPICEYIETPVEG